MKAHFLSLPIPLKEGATIIANCGAVVHNVRVVHAWDGQPMERAPEVDIRQLCRKCHIGEEELLYVVRDGREATE